MTLTTETIKQWRSDAENIARRSCEYETEYSAAEAILALTAELLANREAQPVGYAENGKGFIYPPERRDRIKNPVAVYTAPPAPAVPPGYRLQPISEYDAMCEYVRNAPPAPAVPDDVQRDSDRWRAMLGSARIRILGAAGFDATASPGGDPDYRHFGMEIWTNYPGWLTEKNEYGIDTLTKYADACRAAMLAQPVSSGYKLPEGWIACSERMPDNDETKPIAIYTGKCLGQGMFLATYDEDGFFDYWEGSEIIGITHWMPLPAAPEGGNG